MSTIYSRLTSPSLPSGMQVMGPPDGTQVCRTLLEGSIQMKHSGIHTVCQAVIGPIWSYLDLYAIWCRTYAYIISVHHATFTLFKRAWNGQRSQSSTVPSAHPTNACKQPQFASAELQLSTSKISSTYCYHLLPLHEVVTSERLLFHHCHSSGTSRSARTQKGVAPLRNTYRFQHGLGSNPISARLHRRKQPTPEKAWWMVILL